MKERKCEFEALIGAQGIAYRCGVWARSRRCIALNGRSFGSIGVVVSIIMTVTVGLPLLMFSSEQDLVRLFGV